jgi:hypothetical protein
MPEKPHQCWTSRFLVKSRFASCDGHPLQWGMQKFSAWPMPQAAFNPPGDRGLPVAALVLTDQKD